MERPILVPDSIRSQLRMAFLTHLDLVGAIQGEELEALTDPPGSFRCRPSLAVPRQLDPETAEMRQLEVILEPVEGGLEVSVLSGLDLSATED